MALRRHRFRSRLVVLCLASSWLQSCAEFPALTPDPGPGHETAPLAQSGKPASRPAPPVSEASAGLSVRYASAEADFISRGLLRTDSGEEVEFDAEDLAETFIQLAMYEEYSTVSGQMIAKEAASPLRRWRDPIQMEIRFGRSVPQPQRGRDSATVEELAARLGRLTGHPIRLGSGPANFIIHVMNEDERRALVPDLQRDVPGITPPVLRALDHLSPSEFCAVVGIFDDSRPATLTRALVFIRAEHPPLLRLSCFHEEIAQGLGLANDSPLARPSVFNDDEEFALLTRMDEMLLQMLYDPRLQSGMTIDEVAPIAREIAQELLTTTDTAQAASQEDI